MEVTDSGSKRVFDSGAHRDNAIGKGRCDLLPLAEVSNFLEGDKVLAAISAYQGTQDAKHIQDALVVELIDRIEVSEVFSVEGEKNIDISVSYKFEHPTFEVA